MRKRRGPPVRPSSGPPKPSNLRTKTQTTFRVVVRAPDIKWKPFKIDPELLQRELMDVTASYLPCHLSNDNDKSNNSTIVCSQVMDHNDFIRHHSNNNDTTSVVVCG